MKMSDQVTLQNNKYKSIQFIGYEINTGPISWVIDKDGFIQSVQYPGINLGATVQGASGGTIPQDIDERCKLMMKAIDAANKAATSNEEKNTKAMTKKATKVTTAKKDAKDDNQVLKIFMAPRFFFRGPQGAYTLEQVRTIIHELQDMVKDSKYNDWMFVFGTIAGYPDKYSRYEINNKWLREVYQFCLVQSGGPDAEKQPDKGTLILNKHFMATDDFVFIANNGLSATGVSYTASNLPGVAPGIASKTTDPKKIFSNYCGMSIFSLYGLTFALDISFNLDNTRELPPPPMPGRNMVQVQLRPSAGVKVNPKQIIAQSQGYIFEVDGGMSQGSTLSEITNLHVTDSKPDRGKTYDITMPASPPESPPKSIIDVSKIFVDGPGKIKVYDTIDVPKAIPDQSTVYSAGDDFFKDREHLEGKCHIDYSIQYTTQVSGNSGIPQKNKLTPAKTFMTISLKDYNLDIDWFPVPIDGAALTSANEVKAKVGLVDIPPTPTTGTVYIVDATGKHPAGLQTKGDMAFNMDFYTDIDHIEGNFFPFQRAL
jgi:hypothetical protein